MYHKLKEMKSLTVLEEEIALCDKIISFKKKRGLEYDDWETKKDLAKMQLDNTKMLIESGDMDFDGYKKIIMGELAYEKKILKFTESDKISKPYELKEIKRRIEQRINVINKELTQNIEEENPETEKTSQRTQKSIHSIKKEEPNRMTMNQGNQNYLQQFNYISPQNIPDLQNRELYQDFNLQNNSTHPIPSQENQDQTLNDGKLNDKSDDSEDKKNSKTLKRRSKSEVEGRTHQCKLCNKSYLSYPALYTHYKLKHNTNNSSGKGRGRPKKEQNETK